jgi:hypothetical protein
MVLTPQVSHFTDFLISMFSGESPWAQVWQWPESRSDLRVEYYFNRIFTLIVNAPVRPSTTTRLSCTRPLSATLQSSRNSPPWAWRSIAPYDFAFA